MPSLTTAEIEAVPYFGGLSSCLFWESYDGVDVMSKGCKIDTLCHGCIPTLTITRPLRLISAHPSTFNLGSDEEAKVEELSPIVCCTRADDQFPKDGSSHAAVKHQTISPALLLWSRRGQIHICAAPVACEVPNGTKDAIYLLHPYSLSLGLDKHGLRDRID